MPCEYTSDKKHEELVFQFENQIVVYLNLNQNKRIQTWLRDNGVFATTPI